MTTWTSRIQYIRYGSSSGTSPLFQEGAVWLQATAPDSWNQLIWVCRQLIGQTVSAWLVGTDTCRHRTGNSVDVPGLAVAQCCWYIRFLKSFNNVSWRKATCSWPEDFCSKERFRCHPSEGIFCVWSRDNRACGCQENILALTVPR